MIARKMILNYGGNKKNLTFITARIDDGLDTLILI